MQFHLPVSASEIFWALTFAGHLVVLVVLLGRNRIRQFPFFTTNIVLIAFRLLAARMLNGRVPQVTMATIFIGLADIGAIISALMLVELARRAFGTAKRTTWIAGALTIMAVGVVVLATWGSWPSWKTLTAQGLMSKLQLLQLIGLKASLLIDVETILLAVTIVIFGSRFHAGWRTHTQRIAIGLGVASLAQLGMEATWEIIARHAKPQSMAEYQHFMDLRNYLFNGNSAVYILVLIWWIAILWRDEPGTDSNAAVQPAALPE